MLNIELMRGTRSRLIAVQEEWEIRNALDVGLKPDENMEFRSQEPKLQPHRPQGCVQQIQGHGFNKNQTVKDGSEPDVHRRGSVRGTKNTVTRGKNAGHMNPGKPRVQRRKENTEM